MPLNYKIIPLLQKGIFYFKVINKFLSIYVFWPV